MTRLLDEVPALGVTIEWAKRLNALLRRKVVGDLDEILSAADGTMLAKFAAGLRRDVAAISAALELPWTTSPVEGQISRLKMLKRTMYGRAGFKLLRARVLHAAYCKRQHANCGRTWIGSPANCVLLEASNGMQDPRTQKVEPGAAIHGPFQHLESVDLTLSGTRGPGKIECGLYGAAVAPQAANKLLQRRITRMSQYLIEALIAVSTQHLVQPLRGGDARGELGHLRQEAPGEGQVHLGQKVTIRHQQARHVPGRQWLICTAVCPRAEPFTLASATGPVAHGSRPTSEAKRDKLAPE